MMYLSDCATILDDIGLFLIEIRQVGNVAYEAQQLFKVHLSEDEPMTGNYDVISYFYAVEDDLIARIHRAYSDCYLESASGKL
jgi:hypothetical protein